MKYFLLPLLLLFTLSCKKTEDLASNTTAAIEDPITFQEKLSNAAIAIIDPTVAYDPSYTSIKYPNGAMWKKIKEFVRMS